MACFPLSGLALDSVNEFPDPIEVFQKKVRYYITWGYLKKRPKGRFFRFFISISALKLFPYLQRIKLGSRPGVIGVSELSGMSLSRLSSSGPRFPRYGFERRAGIRRAMPTAAPEGEKSPPR